MQATSWHNTIAQTARSVRLGGLCQLFPLVHCQLSQSPSPALTWTPFSHKPQPLHSPFHYPCGKRGKQVFYHLLLSKISKNPLFHSLDLENQPLSQPSPLQVLEPSFHFSLINDGYYYLFLNSYPLFSHPSRAPTPVLACPARSTATKCFSERVSKQNVLESTESTLFSTRAFTCEVTTIEKDQGQPFPHRRKLL